MLEMWFELDHANAIGLMKTYFSMTTKKIKIKKEKKEKESGRRKGVMNVVGEGNKSKNNVSGKEYLKEKKKERKNEDEDEEDYNQDIAIFTM